MQWEFLGLAVACHVIKLLFRAGAWRAIVDAAYPGQRLKYRTALGAYVAGVGVNSIVPARGGDLVKLYLVKHRIPDANYATLAPTLIVETLFDFVTAGALIIWALATGVLPTHQFYSRIPTVDWKFFLRHERFSEIALAVLVVAAVVAHSLGAPARRRVSRTRSAGLRDPARPPRFLLGVILPQAISWVFRIASLFFFLKAFGVHRDDPQRAARAGRRLARDALPRDAWRRRNEAGADRVPLPRPRRLAHAAARIQRRHEHRDRRREPPARACSRSG